MTRRVRAYGNLVLRGLLVCAAYYWLLAWLRPTISVVVHLHNLAANTVLLVALLLSSAWQWPWLLLIAFPVHLVAQVQLGASLSAAGLCYVFNCALVPTTAAVMRRFGLGDSLLAICAKR